jgi:hypothetical protein
MQYTLTINCDGVAFMADPIQEIVSVLVRHARFLSEDWSTLAGPGGRVKDGNGNPVGEWTYGRTPAKGGKYKSYPKRMTAEQFF